MCAYYCTFLLKKDSSDMLSRAGDSVCDSENLLFIGESFLKWNRDRMMDRIRTNGAMLRRERIAYGKESEAWGDWSWPKRGRLSKKCVFRASGCGFYCPL